MMEPIVYTVLLLILGILIVFILRQKGVYFRLVQIFFFAAFSAIGFMVFLDLVKNYLFVSEFVVFFATEGGVTAILAAAVLVEHAALILYAGKGWIFGRKKQEKFSWKEFFSKKTNLFSVIYKGYVVFLLILTWVFAPWQTQEVRDIWGGLVYSPLFEGWYLALLSTVLIAFVAYPCMLFILSSRKRKEKGAVNALRWLGVCWISIGFSVIICNGFLRSFGLEMIEVGYSLNLIFLVVIIHFFKKATILESFFQEPYPSISVGGNETILVTYTSKTDKMKVFSAYIREGLLSGDRVVYRYPEDEDGMIREKLREYGVDVEKYERDGSLILRTLQQFHFSGESFDTMKGIRSLKELKAHSIKKGYAHQRDFSDVGDFSFVGKNWDDYLKYLNDERWGDYLDDYIIELYAANAEKVDEKLIRKLINGYTACASVRSTRSIDLIKEMEVFSKKMGLTHRGIVGKKILFEFDPFSNYGGVIQDFVAEASANIEPVAVFTSRGSAIYSALSKREVVRFLILTQCVSVPQVDASANEILLPANNSSLLLEALDKTLRGHPHGNLNIVFDSLSNLILLIGFEKTYNFVRYALEMLAPRNVTALFLFNPSAHDQKVASGLRSLFHSQVTCQKEELQIVKLSQVKEVINDEEGSS